MALARLKKMILPAKNSKAHALIKAAETAVKKSSGCRATQAKEIEETQNPAAAEKFLRDALAQEPGNIKYRAALAALLLRHDGGAEAVGIFRAIVAEDPRSIKHRVSFGNALAKTGNVEEAEAVLRDAEKLAPGNTEYLVALANVLAQQLKFSEALPYFERAIAAFPDNATLFLRLADVYAGLSRHKDAAAAVKKHLEHDNKNSGVNNRRYRIHQQRAEIFNEEETQIRFFARNYHFANAPELSAVQRRVVEETLDTGIALTHFEELFDARDIDIYRAAEKQAMDFRRKQETQALVDRISSCDSFKDDPYFRDIGKPSLISFIENDRAIRADDPIAAIFAQQKILGIANAYNEMLSKLRNVNLWVNPPIKGRNIGIRKGSQQWHRDQEDEKILKCFIYLTDVDENSGALDYVPFSKCIPERKYSHLHPYPHSTGYPGNYLFDKFVKAEDRITANTRAGGIAFVDTNGFHRGGYVTTTERIVLTATYLRPTSPYVPANTRLQLKDVKADAFTPEALYAVS